MRKSGFLFFLKVAIFLSIVLLITGCPKKEIPQPVILVWTLRGSTTISAFKLINSSDSLAVDAKFFKNDETEPFLVIDSITPHESVEISRSKYKPKITIADKVILKYEYGGKKIEQIYYLARSTSLTGEWSGDAGQ